MTRSTYTYAALEVSPEAYDEIASKLRKAGYGHAFLDDGAIDMAGIGITRATPTARQAAAERLESFATDDAAGGGINRCDRWPFGTLAYPKE